ncbi:MAG: GUN4 domain-containing protein [Cyanobacteria bacterium J06639_16]
MAKVALLVGVSEYQPGLSPLPKAQQDIDAIQRALQSGDPESRFDTVQTLLNPDPQTLRVKIESLFAERSKDDLALLFFSGHGIKDDQGKLYFATRDTQKTATGELIRSTAVNASFVQELMSHSRCRRQVVILDCCFSGAFATGMTAKADDSAVDIKAQLGGEGRVVLTSSTSTQYSFEDQSSDLSIYTRYIVEGLSTGVADLNHDGWVDVEELHNYAKSKVRETAPAMHPEIYAVKEGFKIQLIRAQIDDPALRYRQEAQRYVNQGEISQVGRMILDTLRDQLGLTTETANKIEDEVLHPYRERLSNIERYRQAVKTAIASGQPLSDQTRRELKQFQHLLGLQHDDIAPVEAALLPAAPQPVAAQPITRQSFSLSRQRLFQLGGVGVAIAAVVTLSIVLMRPPGEQSSQSETSPSEPTASPNAIAPSSESPPWVDIAPTDNTTYPNSWTNPEELNLASSSYLSSDYYANLRQLLAAQRWQDANVETFRMLNFLTSATATTNELACEDLRMLDQLWLEHSDNRFGFSVQKEVYKSVGGTLENTRDRETAQPFLLKFAEQVGWKEPDVWRFNQKLSLDAPKGHLPQLEDYQGTVEFFGEETSRTFILNDLTRLLRTFVQVETCGL